MTFTLLQALWSIVVMITFLGIVFWAYSGKRKKAFDEAANLPFDDEPSKDSDKPFLPTKNSSE
jgi:cytochrome c oxidase cbb3-type subunit 4